MKQTMKRALSLLLALAALLSLLTAPAGAAGGTEITGDTTITTGGTYQLAPGVSGTIRINTTQAVTIAGNGAEWDSDFSMTSTPHSGLYFDCTGQAGVNLTLRDVYISNTESITCFDGSGCGIVGVAGTGNILKFEGVNVLDYNISGGANPSAIHVRRGNELIIGGTGTLYFYKSAQGAGIGGSSGELNGDISFRDLTMFAKGTKQGALIGAGSNSGQDKGLPGSITFESGTYNLLSVSRGAVIGGSAGSSGASAGTEVYIKGGSINVNVDFTGAAVGGGGYDKGNDSSGGTVYFTGGSLRIFTDANAMDEDVGDSPTGYNGVEFALGTVNDASMTAARKNGDGENVYRCVIDTAGIAANKSGDAYIARVDGAEFFSGSLHEYHYINETLLQDEQIKVSSTPSNWETNPDESKLYLYLTGENHRIDVNGTTLMAVWNAESEIFTVEEHPRHSFGTEWMADAAGHWLQCACGAKTQAGVHTPGPWIIDEEATATQLGSKHRACTVCGFWTDVETVSLSDYTLSISDGVSGIAEVQYGDTVTMNVTVTSESGAGFQGMQAAITYDPELFALDSVRGAAAAGTVKTKGSVELYTLDNEGYSNGTTAAVLTFTVIYKSADEAVGSFCFADGATVGNYEDFRDDALAAAVSGDSVRILAAKETYPVTLGSGLSGGGTAAYGEAYTGKIDEYDPVVYKYTVIYTIHEKSYTITEFDSDGSFTIPAEAVTGAISVTVGKKINYYSVTLPEDEEERYTVTALDKTTGIKGREPFSFVVRVKDGYKIDSVQANGLEVAPDEDGIYTITVLANTEITVKVSKKVLGGDPEAEVWDGETIDIRWFTDNPRASKFYITYPAEFAGLAALVNGIYNEEIRYIYGDESYIVDLYSTGTSGGNNESTAAYHYGAYDFNGKTIYLCADIDMGTGNNYMPIGGQYLMTEEDAGTKIGSSFCGVLDGQGHNVTIYCDRHCSSNYGDGSSIGLIGRLGCHDSDPSNMWPAGAGVYNLAVYGSVKGNRSVGGIVGKIGKTNGGATIECCANFASVYGTDAKGTGGICGAAWNGGVIRNCYNSGTVISTFTNAVAGIVGSCEIDLINCYNVGSVIDSRTTTAAIASNNGGSTYTNCYWLAGSADTGVYSSSTTGAMEKTSSYMRTSEFVSVLGNAFTMDTAYINNGYPVLTWQKTSAVGAVIKSTTTVQNGVATTTVTADDVSASVAAAKKEKFDILYIITDTEGKSADQTAVEIPRTSVKEIAGASLSLSIEVADGSRVTMSAETLSSTSSRAAGDSVVLTVIPRTVEYAKDLLGKAAGYENTYLERSVAVSISISSGGVELRNFTEKLNVEIPVDGEDFRPGEAYDVLQFLSDGTVNKLSGKCVSDGGQHYISFSASGLGTFVVLNSAPAAYDDVKAEDWFYEAVMYVTEKGLMNGVGNNLFAPDGTMTRAMLVTVLYRLEGSPAVTSAEAFPDVEKGQWYSDAVVWASTNGIVKGYDSGLFGTTDSATREQIAAIMYRYAQFKGYDVFAAAELSHYADAEDISNWASAGMAWANATGLITGRTTTTLVPQGTATRTEVAAILMRFCENVINWA